ncbi:tRNA 5-methylaminomethyl-2-thiouridine biosynthesis bifunctional protein MnmC [Aliiroseovarius sp. xm-m-379]|uniref:TIGR03862 family flavoprotein n=1 Tax=unclassified Aliiroseovarius TaxID=2623558 RepID=UPI001569998A|nr:tRNA 5-methylaminomethyl-2-thiouridine biosynthesis bifunctional protein MnmC [Aliiroseovarius sp. xm-m-379]NRP35067.1 tRNA 5-methylaminomethyl-2-thiouridine biosynthesis bifunctional protein MnmC [Aliiroseovarius sp. xm-a-104]NRP51336.1 tRNA 5-methylaminomethyl-2-thiouridine biosynthesis bifunctional protein MnmC [Aliiroseovarius sp. xm-m-354]NRQ06086.1 tRNA 5-methylaminomethyl-2-thiouridine biosynthesis bifunctional protein MnmC [Aliiroseovarius sp. xm-m-309]NRQ09290.1 tRNA 5-methylaminome
MKTALVIGAGPAGLMAAGELARAGVRVTLAEAKPSPARKFLMAGKSGLNLTKDEPLEQFLANYSGSERIRDITAGFGPEAVMGWARDLGQEVFTGSSGRVFPKAMKASPLLRAWMAELGELGVQLKTRWRWMGWEGKALIFDTPDGRVIDRPDATVLALGGASWRRLGSDAAWVPWLAQKGLTLAPFQPSNVGLVVQWSDHMQKHFGRPIKPARLSAGAHSVRGEFVISSRGLEGSAIYAMSRALREGAALFVDLVPERDVADVAARLGRARGRATLTNHLRKQLKLGPAQIALLQEFARPLPQAPEQLASLIKAVPIRHEGSRPLDEAISVAGGLRFEELDQGLMIRALSGVFACGEMLDWDAPTGGYLLTACLATGRHAGRAAADYLSR